MGLSGGCGSFIVGTMHRVGRVQSIFSVVGIGTHPTPHPPVVLFIYTYFVVGTMGINIAGTGRMVALPDNHIRLLRIEIDMKDFGTCLHFTDFLHSWFSTC